MLTITGLVAVALVFLSGPYHTLQIRWPRVWGSPLSTWAHSNVSLAAAVAVFIHIAPRFAKLSVSLLWISTWLFVLTVLSGLYGLYLTSELTMPKWLKIQRTLSYLFYASVLPHVVGSLLGWAAIGAVAIGWALWQWRAPIRQRLGGTTVPFSKGSTAATGRRPESTRSMVRVVTSLPTLMAVLILMGAATAVLVGLSLDRAAKEIEVRGQITEVDNGSFTLTTADRSYQVVTSSRTKFEDIEENLESLQEQGLTIKVEGYRRGDGAIEAKEIEIKDSKQNSEDD